MFARNSLAGYCVFERDNSLAFMACKNLLLNYFQSNSGAPIPPAMVLGLSGSGITFALITFLAARPRRAMHGKL